MENTILTKGQTLKANATQIIICKLIFNEATYKEHVFTEATYKEHIFTKATYKEHVFTKAIYKKRRFY